jgi:hypothetical protein
VQDPGYCLSIYNSVKSVFQKNQTSSGCATKKIVCVRFFYPSLHKLYKIAALQIPTERIDF